MIAPARRAALTAIPSIGCIVVPGIGKERCNEARDSSMNSPGALSGIRVVLARPSHPGNIGAAARAMKTMGLARLYLVQAPSIAGPAARRFGANWTDVVESATFD